jgi:galactose mutarotase-like enzyme
VFTHEVTLYHGDMRLVVDPVRGGAVREFSKSGEHLFRHTLRDAEDDPFSFACFRWRRTRTGLPMGRFHFRGRDVQLAPNRAGEIHPLHGDAWGSVWDRTRGVPIERGIRVRRRRRCMALALSLRAVLRVAG